jgi:hypothetical protein
VLCEAEQLHLERELYPRALAAAGEPDTPRNRQIAASDYWQFLELGGGSDADATAALVRGLRSCDAPR